MPVDMKMEILIVGGNEAMLEILANILRRLNFNNLQWASEGQKGLDKLRQEEFGLIISDWDTQPMSGIQFLREVRDDAKLKQIPFIMIMAESKSENVIAAKNAGVSNLIVRPFNEDTLKSKLVSVLGNF